MTERHQFWSGDWGRFSRYEIRDGAVRAAPGAKFESYDPWEIYRASEWDTETPPPYQSLFALMLSIGAVFDQQEWQPKQWHLNKKIADLTSNDQAEILDWCARFGLLGILPHLASMIELPIRLGAHDGEGGHVVRDLLRVNGQWSKRTAIDFPASPLFSENIDQFLNRDMDLVTLDKPVLGRFLAEGEKYFRVPRVTLQEGPSSGHSIYSRPVEHLLDRFFPEFKDAGDQFECPLPLTPMFWEIYSESVDDFVEHALFLMSAAEPVLSRRAHHNLKQLEFLVEPVGISLSSASKGDIQEQWACPSLLSSFARMALQTMWAGKRLLRCDCCGEPFLTAGYQSRYCSEQCGWRHRKRQAVLRKSAKQLNKSIRGSEA